MLIILFLLYFRIQNNYLALQRINQDLEDKLYRMVSTGSYCTIIKLTCVILWLPE